MKKQSDDTRDAFQILLRWLDPDPDIAGDRYELIRRRLIRVFAGRGCYEAEDLADRTFERVIQKLPEIVETYIGDPSLYFFSVAKNIHREWLRTQRRRTEIEFERVPAAEPVETSDVGFDCLDDCLKSIPPNQSELLLSYYRDDRRAKIEHRRAMAERLGISPTALQIKLHRIRKTLRGCVENCLGGKHD